MIRNVLTHIGGIEGYGIVSILLFFAVFTATLVWAFRLKRSDLEAMGRIPLSNDDATDDQTATQPTATLSPKSHE